MIMRAILITLLAFKAMATSPNSRLVDSRPGHNLRSSVQEVQCHESFPLASPPPRGRDGDERRLLRRERSLVSIDRDIWGEYYETGEYYAPLCPDGRHVDIRRLMRCNAGACWNEYINQCTFECTWNEPTPKPTGIPTQKPTFPLEVTEHPLLLSLGDLPKQYRMNPEVRAAIIRYIRDRLKIDLEELGLKLELLEVHSPGRIAGKPHALPLNVKIRGPSDISDFALSYLMQTMRDANQEIVKSLRQLDKDNVEFQDPFQNVSLLIETFDFADIVDTDTRPPTGSPIITGAPTDPPTLPPKPMSVPEPVVIMEDDTTGTPWWVWLIVVLVILLCAICICCYCIRRRRSDSDKDEGKLQQFNVNIENRMLPGRPNERRQSVETRSKRSQRPSKSIATRDDQTRKTRRAHDDQSRRTSRTKKSHKTRSSRAPVPTPEVAVPVMEEYDDDMLTEASPITRAPADAATAVSRLSGGDDPPEEQNAAIVLYDPNKKVARDPTMYNPNPDAKDPTFFTGQAILPDQAEPEGDKINRKKSMFADAHLMNEVHRERDEEAERRRSSRKQSRRRSSMERMGNRLKESFRWAKPSEGEAIEPPEDGLGNQLCLENGPMSEPEGLTSDELPAPKRKSKRKSQRKKESTSRPKSRSMGDRLKQSFNWNRTDMQLDLEALPNDESDGYDSPSILTNHNPPGKKDEEVQQQVEPDRQVEGYNQHEENRRASSNRRQSRKKKGKKKEGLFSSIKRRSSNFARDGVDSENESFHGDEEYNPGMNHRESRASC